MNKKYIEDRIKFYEDSKIAIDTKSQHFLPFYGFNRLQKFIPGIIPGVMYKITSHMGMGKTQLAKYLFVYQPLLYALKNNINFKIIYFALEESKEEFLDGLFVHLVGRLKKIKVNKFSLTGNSDFSVSKLELDAIKDVENTVKLMMEHIIIIDNAYTPSEMMNICEKFANKWGTFNTDNEYIKKDPKQIVLVVNDHISLLSSEFDTASNTYLDDRKTIAKWHTHYCKRIITKKYRWAALNVQQQTLESEKQQFTSKGDSIINKILPTLDGLANNKEVGRDDYVVLGLFAPERYSIDNFRGYTIVKDVPEAFGDRFRSLHLLKNRFGHPNKMLPLYFDGSYNYFKEMPNPLDPGMAYFHSLLKT